MIAQVRHPLADLLGNEPRWPDPEESIGDFIKLIDGKKSCWKAKGRARAVFEILSEDIKTSLDHGGKFKRLLGRAESWRDTLASSPGTLLYLRTWTSLSRWHRTLYLTKT